MTILKFGLKNSKTAEVEMDFSKLSFPDSFLFRYINCNSDMESMDMLSLLQTPRDGKIEENGCFQNFYGHLGRNILHYTIERHFQGSSAKLMEDHEDQMPLMLKQTDRARRTPLMTAKSEGLTQVENMIVEYFRNVKESDPLTGVDQKGKTVSLVLSLLNFNLEYVIIAQRI